MANYSCVTLDECVRNLANWTSCSIAQAVECVTAHPAELLGISNKKGSLRYGLDADLVILDDAGNVFQTWKFGEKVYDVAEPEKTTTEEKEEKVPLTKVRSPPSELLTPFGERYTRSESPLRVISPNGLKVH
jgi:predicted amidohydrolase YtcJ